jgi:hypothetical protein
VTNPAVVALPTALAAMKIVYEGWDPGANVLQCNINAAQHMSLCACICQLQGSTAGWVEHTHTAL